MGGVLTLGYCLRKICHCFPIVFWMEENKVMMGRFPIPSIMENPVHFTCIFENVCQTSVVMSHKCNCMIWHLSLMFCFQSQTPGH